MSVQVEKLEGSMAKLTIEVAAEEVDKAIEKAYEKNKNKISIAGFRKGKAPRKMIEKMYGPEVFYEDAANEMIPDAYDAAVTECGEDIVSNPKISVVQIEEGKPFIFTAEVALKPAVELGKYKGVKVETEDATVTDADVDAELEKVRNENARELVANDRPVKDGDMIVLDFEGYVDGVAFEGGKGENYSLTIGSGSFIPGFEDQLIGKKVDEDVDVTVTFPEDYHADELAGKEAVFKCLIHEIKEKELPEIDDEFAAEVSEFETLAEYKEDLKKNLQEKKEASAKRAKEEALIDKISGDSKIEIPEAMIETQQRQMVEEFGQRLSYQGLSLEQYFQFTGSNAKSFLEEVKPQAEKRIRTRLTLEAIAEAEKIEVTEEELEEELKKMAESYQMELDKVKDLMGDYEMKQLKGDIAVQKAVDLVVAAAK